MFKSTISDEYMWLTLFTLKVLKGHPKDIDVEGERSEKRQGWALSAFIKVCEAKTRASNFPWKALIGHPKADFLDIDDDVDAEISEKRQGWAFIAFIEGEREV